MVGWTLHAPDQDRAQGGGDLLHLAHAETGDRGQGRAQLPEGVAEPGPGADLHEDQGAVGLGLRLSNSFTPIQPLIAGGPERALAWSRQLERAGILVGAIRPPTVPEGSARLRITFSAAHTETDVDRLLEALAELPEREAA